MKIVDTTVSTFITSLSRLLTFERCASSMPVIRSWKISTSSAIADEVIVDVAEAERHLGADVDEIAPRQAGDDVALRRDDAAQAGDLALLVEDPADQLRLGLVEDLLLQIVEPLLELVDLGPVGVDHRVDDAVKQRDRALGQDLRDCGSRGRAAR